MRKHNDQSQNTSAITSDGKGTDKSRCWLDGPTLKYWENVICCCVFFFVVVFFVICCCDCCSRATVNNMITQNKSFMYGFYRLVSFFLHQEGSFFSSFIFCEQDYSKTTETIKVWSRSRIYFCLTWRDELITRAATNDYSDNRLIIDYWND